MHIFKCWIIVHFVVCRCTLKIWKSLFSKWWWIAIICNNFSQVHSKYWRDYHGQLISDWKTFWRGVGKDLVYAKKRKGGGEKERKTDNFRFSVKRRLSTLVNTKLCFHQGWETFKTKNQLCHYHCKRTK